MKRLPPDRYWLLTWTTFGTWLPGDERGFVSSVRNRDGSRVTYNQPQTDCQRDIAEMRNRANALLTRSPTRLTPDQAMTVLAQIHSTSEHRGWTLLAIAVMRNHVHVVVGVPGDPDPQTLLRDFKAYASRALNRGEVHAGTQRWWTKSGSVRKLAGETAVAAAVRYVADQEYPLMQWSHARAPGEPPA